MNLVLTGQKTLINISWMCGFLSLGVNKKIDFLRIYKFRFKSIRDGGRSLLPLPILISFAKGIEIRDLAVNLYQHRVVGYE